MKHFYLLWSLLDKSQRLYFFYMVFLMLIQAVLEILSIALVIPFTALILDPSQKTDLLILDNLSFFIESYERESLLPICATIFFIIFVIKNISLVFIYNSISMSNCLAFLCINQSFCNKLVKVFIQGK